MRKAVLSLTTALAIGALAMPTIALAAQKGGHDGGGRSARASQGSGGAKFSANNGRNNGQNFKGDNNRRWSGHGHGHHHGGSGWWLPYAAFGAIGAYAAYDRCWDTILTPDGYRRVYVCGPTGYNYY